MLPLGTKGNIHVTDVAFSLPEIGPICFSSVTFKWCWYSGDKFDDV